MHQIAPFKKKFSREHAPELTPLANAIQTPPLFQKHFDPPPRNEDL